MRTFNVGDYGAVGDGVTDDTAAINAAIEAAKAYSEKYDESATVAFGDKTYATSKTISVKDSNGLVISGNGATIVGTPNASYMTVTGNSNLKISNLNFTYNTPVAYCAEVTARSGAEVTFKVPELYVSCVENNTLASNSFAIPANDRRDHAYISTIEKVDDTHVKVTFADMYPNGWSILYTEEKLATATRDIATNYAYLPTPGYAHSSTPAFGVRSNIGAVEMKNCNIWNASGFVYHINGNLGEVKLTNVNLTPKDSDACETVAWRDVVHAKDNRGPINVTECNFGGTHDDIFNISNTMCRVDAVTDSTLTLYGMDYNGQFVKIYEGDTVVAFNPTTDKYYGEAKVAEVVVQNGKDIQIKLDTDIGIEQGAYIYFKEWACPDSTINGGSYDGTFRIRASGTNITNADFKVLQMWTAYDGNNGPWEGPIPENITYTNCKFSGANSETWTRMSFDCKLLDGTTAKSYAVKNIVFDGCEFAYDSIIDRTNTGVIIK